MSNVSSKYRNFPKLINPQTLLDHFKANHLSESTTIIFTSLIVGVGAGLGAVFFRWLIHAVGTLTFGNAADYFIGLPPYYLIFIPAIGGLIVGPLIYNFAREAKGHGVPEVMEAVALRGGRIRPRVAVVKSLASAICIGTGGSVGREGPIAQIGSALGSSIGQWLKLSDERIRNLVACGAAGGVAATFNAPIAATIFALEVILGQFHVTYFGAVVISAVTADVVAHLFEGNLRAFTIPQYSMVSPWELLFYLLLGVLAAVAAYIFTRLLYFSEDLWKKLPIKEYIQPAVGGLILGVIGLLSYKLDGFPRIFGVGYESITEALHGSIPFQVLVGLLALKMLGTIITLGSGGSGGVFAPSLFLGAMLGQLFGLGVNHFFPGITAPPGAYAVVGMSAFFSGAAHAPITAVLIIFELTGDYQIILPLMLATVISTIVSRVISQESIYTLKLTRRGIHLENGQDIDILQSVTVGEIMTTVVDTVDADFPLDKLAEEFESTHHHGFPVVDKFGELTGIVTLQDLNNAITNGPIEDKVVGDIATIENVLVAYPGEAMGDALRRLSARDVGRLPVIEEEGSRKIVGVLRRVDVIRAYNHAIVNRASHQHRVETLRLNNLNEASFYHIDVSKNSPAVGKTISEIQLPENCLIVSIRRNRKLIIAHGSTKINPDDKIAVFSNHDCIKEVQQVLEKSEAAP